MLIDVLLKYFFKDSYDLECCKEHCDCPEGAQIECEEGEQTESNYDVLVKLFKPHDGELDVQEVESSDDGVSDADKEEVAHAVQEAVDKINSILFKN